MTKSGKPIDHQLPTQLDPAHYEAIGRVAAKWTLLEMRLQAVIWHYLGLDLKKGRVLTYGLTSTAMLTLLQTVPLRWIPDAQDKAEVEAIAHKADGLRKRRNNYVHGVWAQEPSDKKKRMFLLFLNSGERKIIAKRQVTTVKDIIGLSDEIDALHTRVISLLKKIGAKIP